MKTYGYIRVSSSDQNVDRQIDSMKRHGIKDDFLFIDKQSGKDFHRPQWNTLMHRLNKGDLLCVTSLDRMGRNYEEIQEQWRHITKDKQVDILVFDMPLLDTRKNKDLLGTLIADIVLQVLAYAAQHEREAIKQRQKEGIAAALARGVKFGREEKPLPDNFAKVVQRKLDGEITWQQASDNLNMPLSSLIYRARKMGLITHTCLKIKKLFPKTYSLEDYRERVSQLRSECEKARISGTEEEYQRARFIWQNAKGYLRKLEKKEAEQCTHQ